MFSGLVEEIGTIEQILRERDYFKITILANFILEDVKVDDSIAVNGICLTVISFTKFSFTAIAVKETIERSCLKYFKVGDEVNLERALKVSDRLGGHIVQGHIDAIGKVSKIKKLQNSNEFEIRTDQHLMKYIVFKGSIALDGVSLTVFETGPDFFKVAIIPHTITSTIIKNWKVGSLLNIETDIIGRYLEKMVLESKKENLLDKLKKYDF